MNKNKTIMEPSSPISAHGRS